MMEIITIIMTKTIIIKRIMRIMITELIAIMITLKAIMITILMTIVILITKLIFSILIVTMTMKTVLTCSSYFFFGSIFQSTIKILH